MDLEALLAQVKEAIFRDPSTPQRAGHDPTGLIGQIEGLFRGRQEQPQTRPQVLPASQDPYGDPADVGGGYAYADRGYGQPVGTEYGNIRPASEDPYGDPADQTSEAAAYPNLRPASEDPLGDPADEEERRRW